MQQSIKLNKFFLDDKSVYTIQAILKSGKDVEIRRRGDGYVVLEVDKKIKHST